MSVFEFDFEYQPPAPSFQIRVSGSKTETDTLIAMIDTGADATFVPLSILNQIGASKVSDAIVRSHWGEARVVPMHQIDVSIGIFTLNSIDVIGDSAGDAIILGRNILNRLVFLIDGIGNVTELKDALS